MKILIKNMVCDRCIKVVGQLLDDAQIAYKNIRLGEVETINNPAEAQLNVFKELLSDNGFEILDDKRSALVESIKNIIIQLIQKNSETLITHKLSALLEEATGYDYHLLSTLFSSVEGVTIERYTILQRIEKVKELLTYNEMNLSDIAYTMGYSSVAHLSAQFKKMSGFTPTEFKKTGGQRRTLDNII
ncbi:AraC family transcriptional regulator [Hydrotalea sp.]|uniref:helix-turn-helix domain-containing protein n=1 Tax=Hydrotalea sp. TaxID=2881279 RepID=UPI00260F3A99|nr:AraC family transcriptional regulator [Hydrotalea sp.]